MFPAKAITNHVIFGECPLQFSSDHHEITMKSPVFDGWSLHWTLEASCLFHQTTHEIHIVFPSNSYDILIKIQINYIIILYDADIFIIFHNSHDIAMKYDNYSLSKKYSLCFMVFPRRIFHGFVGPPCRTSHPRPWTPSARCLHVHAAVCLRAVKSSFWNMKMRL